MARFKRRKLGPSLFVRQALSGNSLVDAGEPAALAPAFVPGNRNAGDGTAGLGENEQFRRFGAGRSATCGEGEEGKEEGEAFHGSPLVEEIEKVEGVEEVESVKGQGSSCVAGCGGLSINSQCPTIGNASNDNANGIGSRTGLGF